MNVTTESLKNAKDLRFQVQQALDDPSEKYLQMSTSEFYESLDADYQVSVSY